MAARQLRQLVVLVVLAVAGALLPVVLAAPAGAASTTGSWFTPLSGFTAGKGDRVRVAPRDYTAYRLDLARARTQLGQGPATVAVPDPSGRLVQFRVQEDSVMQPGLQARHPEIRTYAGRGVADPTRTIRLDVSPMGFHASVRSPGGERAWYVDPARNERGTTTHLSYYGSSVAQPDGLFVERDLADTARALAAAPDATAAAAAAPGNEVLRRTYRLAFVTDPTYASYFGTANVLAEKTTLINRVNQIYNDDLAIKLVLIDGTDKLNLDTAAKATDANGPCGVSACFTADDLSTCSGSTLDRNEFVLGQLVGADAFDLGHIGLGVNGGGIAGLGVVGGASKADGCTGLPTPEGDFYAIDYVAHEMGHQFGGNHTFNGDQANCSLTNRNGPTSVEPGSGSSVMAYAGICGTDDLQPHTDPYFSQRSIDEITDTVTAAPFTNNENQTVTLKGFDTDGDSVQLTFPGHDPVTIVRGTPTYTNLAVAQQIFQLTGYRVTLSGYDSSSPQLNDGGFEIAFNLGGGRSIDIPRIGVGATTGGVTAFVGNLVQGGDETNQGTPNATGNHAPTVIAPADRTIPLQTPFTLTGSGEDSDGTPLTYLWEQNDVGGAAGTSLVSNTKADGPLFRVFGTSAQVTPGGTLQSPSPGENLVNGNPSRTFPDLAQILAGNTNAKTGACPAAPADPEAEVPAAVVDCFSEFLPTADYGTPVVGGELNFRLTGRDGFALGGGTSYDDVTLTVDNTAGPFLVTSRGTAGQGAVGGTTEAVTWAVNGTDAAGLAPNVKISLSTDGGQTFPTVLAASTPNDGTADVTIPNVRTSSARLKIEAVGNYFFDVNDALFAITAPLTVSPVAAQQVQWSDAFAPAVTLTAESDSVDGDELTATVAGLDGLNLTIQSTSADGVRPGRRVFVVGGAVEEAPGAYTASVAVKEPGASGRTETRTFAVTVVPESAGASYTGPTDVTAEDGKTATVPLEASVVDPSDGNPGDVTTATVTFVDRETDETLCSAPVTGGPASGTATCDAELAADGASTDHTVGIVVGGRYVRDNPVDDTTVTVHGDEDTTAPNTSITAGPRSFVLSRNTLVRFDSTESGSTYVCTLDGDRVPCSDGGKRLRRLAVGTHVFEVAARDDSGNLDPTPARRVFAAPYGVRQLERAAGSWRQQRDHASYRGRYLSTSAPGAELSRRARQATLVALVVGTGPGFGRVAVFLGGRRIGTVSLDGKRSARELVTVASFAKPRSGPVTVRTLSGRQVRIEGIGLLER